MKQRNCGGCGQPVYRTHHCRASAMADPPVPLNRATFDQVRAEARAEAQAEANAEAQLLIPIDEDPTDECFCGDARSWHPDNRECLVCGPSTHPVVGCKPIGACKRFRLAGPAGWRDALVALDVELDEQQASQNRGGRA